MSRRRSLAGQVADAKAALQLLALLALAAAFLAGGVIALVVHP